MHEKQDVSLWNGSIWPWVCIIGPLLWTTKWTLQKSRYSLISKVTTIYILCGATANSSLGCLIVEVSRPHTIRHIKPVELWTSDQLVAEADTYTKHSKHNRRTLMHDFLYSLTICFLHYYPRHVSSINMPIFRHVNARNMSRIIVYQTYC